MADETLATVAEFAEREGVSPDTARKRVREGLEDGSIKEEGVRRTGRRGRPSRVYRVR